MQYFRRQFERSSICTSWFVGCNVDASPLLINVRRCSITKSTGERRCREKKLSDERKRTHAKVSRLLHRPANSFARKFTTFAKANTEQALRSKPLQSACRKHAVRASSCRRRKAVRVAPDARPPRIANAPKNARNLHEHAHARQRRPLSARERRRRPERRLRVRLIRARNGAAKRRGYLQP